MWATPRGDHERHGFAGERVIHWRKIVEIRDRQVVDRKVVLERVENDVVIAPVREIGNRFDALLILNSVQECNERVFAFATNDVIDVR